jgi:hypothetical protein
MYITRFIRKDHKPPEEYYYRSKAEALAHLDLFREDDSDLYSRIEVLAPDLALLDYITF